MQPTPPGTPPVHPPPPHAAAPANPAQTAGILMLVCGLVILIGTVTKSWFSESRGRNEVGVGLLGMEVCRGGHCQSVSWGDMKGAKIPGDIVAFGYLGFLGGLASVAACGAAGGLALARRTDKIPVKPLMGVLAGTSGAMAFWFVRVLTEGGKMPSPSFSGFVALGGLIAGGYVLKQQLTPLVTQAQGQAAGSYPAGYGQPGAYGYGQPGAYGQPMTPPPMQAAPGMTPPPMQAPPPACPRCGGPLEYAAPYQRWFCRRDNQYV
jgi:hypothetical protein